MKKLGVVVAVAVLVSLVLAATAPAIVADGDGGLKAQLDALVGSERAFCKLAMDQGIRPAFLRYLAPQSVVFRPTAVDGRKWYSDHTDLQGILSWAPEFAEVSRAADLGYTTGPWEFRQKPDDQEAAGYGHYVSLWAKQPDGSWLVVVDVGNSHAKHDRPVSAGRQVSMRGEGPVAGPEALAKIDAAGARSALLDADRAFSSLCALKGAKEAYLAYVSDDLRLYRRDALPSHGRDEMMAALPASPAVLTWQPDAGAVAASGDLGYTYGTAALKQRADQAGGEAFTYVRIWRKQGDGGWKVALDLLNPLPPPPAAKPAS